MIVGTLRLQLVIRQAVSLKDKRRAVLSLKDRMRQRFNVAVAEVEALDRRQLAVLGVAAVGNDRRHLESMLSHCVDFVRAFGAVELSDYEIETW